MSVNTKNQKVAIISGITGQDGSHLADFLCNYYKIVGIVRRSSNPNYSRIEHLLGKIELVEGDISDRDSMTSIISKYRPDEFYNFAAQSHVATSFAQPSYTFDMTGKSVINILQSIVELGLVNKTRFYQASSSEMFGSNYDTRVVYLQKEYPVFTKDSNGNVFSNNLTSCIEKYQNEQTRFAPRSPYAIAKVAAHHITQLYRDSHGIHASCGILFNHEGPRRGENFVTRKITKWIAGFCKEMQSFNIKDIVINEKTITLPNKKTYPKLTLGNIYAQRDWGYAGDYVHAAFLMLQQDKPDDYVICTGQTRSVLDFLKEAFSYAGIVDIDPLSLVYIDPDLFRPCEVEYLRGCSFKAQHELGWTPTHTFNDLVRMMVDHDKEKL